MTIDPYIVLGSAVVGFLVGLTGAGGGALMTPMLILLFNVKPSTAISSDLVAAVFMRPFGAAVHVAKKTVNLNLVGWMVSGSVPAAFLGAYLLHLMGHAETSQTNIEKALGAALLVGAAAMVIRYFLDRRGGHERTAVVHGLEVRPAPTVVIGIVGGLIVGMTSVGSGSLMIVMLLFLYPMLGANQLVGTDLTQAVPLTAAAALGGHHIGNHREYSGRCRGFVHLFEGSRPVHTASDHLCDLRIRPEICGTRDDRSRLGPVCDPARGRQRLACLHAALARCSAGYFRGS